MTTWQISTNRRGFTLIEMAIVLVIVGLLVGVGASMVGVLSSAIKVRQTRDSLDENMQAVASWASANNRLPDTLTASTTTGFTSVAKTSVDVWGRNFIYLYDTSLAPSTAATKDTICGRRSTNLSLTTTDPAATVPNVAYVIISGGDNGSNLNSTFKTGSTFRGGAAYGSSTAIPRTSGGSYAIGGNATGTISVDPNMIDIVRWVTLDELRSKVGCQGAPLKIVNNELPYGNTASSYSATISADGGVPNSTPDTYNWCVQTTTVNVAPAGLTFQKPNSSGVATAIPSVTNLFQTNCTTYGAANWLAAGQLMLSGTPTPTGSYYLTIYVSDTNSNIATKPFVLTINPTN